MRQIHKDSLDKLDDKAFSRLFGSLFFILGVWFFWFDQFSLALGSCILATIIFFIGVKCPEKLNFFNRLWILFGLYISVVVNPVVLGLLFYVVLTPVAVVTRLLGRDILRIRYRSQSQESFWHQIDPADRHIDFTKQY